MLTETEVSAMVKARESAIALANKSLEIGKPFIGAWGVAEALGYPKDSLEFKIATSAAYSVFCDAPIICKDKGEITALEGK